MTRIAIDGLTVSYGGAPVIEGLSVDIPSGSFFTLLGPSGCGKTTLLRTIAGFAQPSAGKLAFDGADVTAVPAHRRGIGMVFQDYALFPDKTVFDNVAYGLRARKIDAPIIAAKVAKFLDRVGMGGFAERYPAALSGGQRQRVALARALVIEPRVLLMDEPLSNLDAKLRVQIRESISDLQREVGITTVFVTHDQEEALALSDRIALMNRGRIEQLGTPEQIYTAPATAYAADFIGAANLLDGTAIASVADAMRLRVEGQELTVMVPSALRGRRSGGDKLRIAVRPEDLKLGPAEETADNALPATIRRRRYLGFKIVYRVELPSGGTVAVDIHGRETRAFREGEAVRLLFDPRATVVVAP
ncbi:MAG: ABC transporter ATP-binding protein [Alphaproteobacteria bacterium]|nr:ABC transporter ATP-binding protein [Alphaproteobacteria bacterium]